MLRDVHFYEVNFRVKAIRSDWFESVLPELFLAFLLRVCPMQIIVSNYYCHVFLFVITEIKMPHQQASWSLFYLYGRKVVVDSSLEVTCLYDVLLRTNPATDMKDLFVCVTRRIGQYFVDTTRNKTNKSELAQKASGVWTSFKAPTEQCVTKSTSRYHVLQVPWGLKCNHWMILEKVSHPVVCVKNGQIISQNAVKVFFKDYIILKMIGSDMQNPAFICFFCISKEFFCLL